MSPRNHPGFPDRFRHPRESGDPAQKCTAGKMVDRLNRALGLHFLFSILLPGSCNFASLGIEDTQWQLCEVHLPLIVLKWL